MSNKNMENFHNFTGNWEMQVNAKKIREKLSVWQYQMLRNV